MESSGQADSKSVPGFENWPRFAWVIAKNKILDSFDKYCMIYVCQSNAFEYFPECQIKPEIKMIWIRIEYMEGVWNGVGNEFLTISLPTSVGVPANKCSLYLVCITGIFWFGKNTNYYTS